MMCEQMRRLGEGAQLTWVTCGMAGNYCNLTENKKCKVEGVGGENNKRKNGGVEC